MSVLPVARLVVLTDRRASARAGRSLDDTVARALAGGAPAVLLREKDLPVADRGRLAERLRALTAASGAQLLIASDITIAGAVGADGIHLAAADPSPATARWTGLRGRSCHDVAEVRAAADEPVDYATVSPVASSASKPGYGPVLGGAGLSRLVAASAVPLLALGGVTPDNAQQWLRTGAIGLAVMGAVMAAEDPARTVCALRTQLEEHVA